MEFPDTFKFVSKLNRKKTDPDKFIFTGAENDNEVSIQLFTYDENNCEMMEGESLQHSEKFSSAGKRFWLNIHGLNKVEIITSICQNQGIHSLAVQDILDVNQRPKHQEYENFSFLSLRSIVPSDEEMVTEQISIVFDTKSLISFQEKKADYFSHIRHRLTENKGILRERGTDYLLYTLIEAILDNYFKTLSKVDDEIESLSFADTRKEPSPDALVKIEQYKKFVQFIKKSILPIKEFTQMVERNECKFVEKKHLKYFAEIKDLCLTLMDNCDMILSSLESSINLFFSVQGHRMNQVMKTLTIVATIFIPLTFIAGVYGMNFTNMPELEWRFGYWGVWFIMLMTISGMIYYFRKKKWF